MNVPKTIIVAFLALLLTAANAALVHRYFTVEVPKRQKKAALENRPSERDLVTRMQKASRGGNHQEALAYALRAYEASKDEATRTTTFPPEEYPGLIADLYLEIHRPADAEKWAKKAVDVFSAHKRRPGSLVASVLDRLLDLYETRAADGTPCPDWIVNALDAHYESQREEFKRKRLWGKVVEINEQALGRNHPTLVPSLKKLAETTWRVPGRDAEAYSLAASHYRRALELIREHQGPCVPEYITVLNALGRLYMLQVKDYGKAAEIYGEMAKCLERAPDGEKRLKLAEALVQLARARIRDKEPASALLLLEKALEIRTRALGNSAPPTVEVRYRLSRAYRDLGRPAKAETLLKQTLQDFRDGNAPGNLNRHQEDIAEELADLYRAQGRYDEAVPMYEQAVQLYEQRQQTLRRTYMTASLRARDRWLEELGSGLLAEKLNRVSRFCTEAGEHYKALVFSRKALSIVKGFEYGTKSPAGPRPSTIPTRKGRVEDSVLLRFLEVVRSMAEARPSDRKDLYGEALEGIQACRDSGPLAEAVVRMAAHAVQTGGPDELKTLFKRRLQAVRERDELLQSTGIASGYCSYLTGFDRRVDPMTILWKEPKKKKWHDLNVEIRGFDRLLKKRYPRFHSLISIEAVTLQDFQRFLKPEEALLVYTLAREGGMAVVVRRDLVDLHPLGFGEDHFETLVRSIRKGLDPTRLTTGGDLPAFDARAAHELYLQVFAPVESSLHGVRHLIVVPHGPLQGLPPGIMVTKPPPGPLQGPEDYRRLAWLTRNYAITLMPSMYMFRALREAEAGPQAPEVFAGFGDPVLEGKAGLSRGLTTVGLVSETPPRKLFGHFPGSRVARVDAVRQLPPLPETSREIRQMATILGADEAAVWLRGRATEAALKDSDLSRFRILAFATHGLVAGELGEIKEPALVFTPPQFASERDDGLLMATEIAGLKLNADWVVLSACNTAAPDGSPGAERLSGLAAAFFYAGARSLLVSHWPVVSEAAITLTTRAIGEAARHPGIGRAEALRRARIALLEGRQSPRFAHPLYWAPLVVVGEGGPGFR